MKKELEFNDDIYTIEIVKKRTIRAYKNSRLICSCMDEATARQVIFNDTLENYQNSEKKIELKEPMYLKDEHFTEIKQ